MLISIIIPVYNVAKHIERCLTSVFKQTYKDLEIILVDDCSPDNSMIIARKIINDTKPNQKIKFLSHSKNKGLSEARNTGIKNASGEYIFFLDSDDLIPFDAIDNLATVMNGDKPNLVVGEVLKISENKKNIISVLSKDNKLFGNKEIRREYLSSNIYEMAWNKLINRNFLLSNNLFFIPSIYHEDFLWSFQLMLVASSLYICKKITYNYYVVDGSITQQITKSKHIEDMLYILKQVTTDFYDLSYSKEDEKLFKSFIFRYIKYIFMVTSDLGYSEWKKNYKFIKANFLTNTPNVTELKLLDKILKINFKGPLYLNYLQYKIMRVLKRVKN